LSEEVSKLFFATPEKKNHRKLEYNLRSRPCHTNNLKKEERRRISKESKSKGWIEDFHFLSLLRPSANLL